jgi:cytochrome c peroxidase
MADHQLGKELSEEQVQSIAAFLGSLTGVADPEYITEPDLPLSSSHTPAPNES